MHAAGFRAETARAEDFRPPTEHRFQRLAEQRFFVGHISQDASSRVHVTAHAFVAFVAGLRRAGQRANAPAFGLRRKRYAVDHRQRHTAAGAAFIAKYGLDAAVGRGLYLQTAIAPAFERAVIHCVTGGIGGVHGSEEDTIFTTKNTKITKEETKRSRNS